MYVIASSTPISPIRRYMYIYVTLVIDDQHCILKCVFFVDMWDGHNIHVIHLRVVLFISCSHLFYKSTPNQMLTYGIPCKAFEHGLPCPKGGIHQPERCHASACMSDNGESFAGTCDLLASTQNEIAQQIYWAEL